MVSSKITIIISMVSNVMAPFSVVTEVAPISVVGITMAPFSMVTEMAPVAVVSITMSPFSVSSMITVVAPGKGITMVGISVVNIAVMAPWFMVFVSMNNSNLGVDVMGFMRWSMVVVMTPMVIMIPVVIVMVIMIPVVTPSLMVIMVSPSVVIIMVSPSVMVIMMVIVVAPSVVIIVMVIMMDIMMLIMMSIWVHNSFSMFWCLCFLFSWFWCFLLWLFFFSRFLLWSRLFSVHVSLVVKRDSIHLLSKENLGKCKTKGVSEFIIMLVLPLCHSIHKFVVYILSIYNKIMINMENEIPWVSEGLGHGFEFI